MQQQTAHINIDDAVLVERSQNGDSDSLEQLIIKYQNRIFNVILKICANRHDAAELTQDTFVKVIENIGKFQGKSGFYTWAFRIAVNLTLNYCQRNARVPFRSLDEQYNIDDGQAKAQLKDFLSDESTPDPAAVAQSKELCQMVATALTKLDDAHRTVIVLRDIEGMNYAHIAEVLQVQVGTVKSRLSRARGSLRDVLETMLQ